MGVELLVYMFKLLVIVVYQLGVNVKFPLCHLMALGSNHQKQHLRLKVQVCTVVIKVVKIGILLQVERKDQNQQS